MQTQTKSFFSPVSNTKPFFKAAFEGFAGTGKTYTASQVAIGIHKLVKSDKPVVMIDTEKGAKFLEGMFKKEGIELLVRESKSLADLQEAMRMCREGFSDILLIDSLSHIWENFIEQYLADKRKNRLEMLDWGVIKPMWKRLFSQPLVNDPYHIIFCGRAGFEYESELNKDTGKREIYKSGVKMKVEGETAFEPDMLVLMERFEELLTENKRIWRQATIVKDRTGLIDGKVFENPTYDHFKVAITAMLENPSNVENAPETSLKFEFLSDEEKYAYRRERDKALEEIESLLVSVAPGQSGNEKKFKVDVLHRTFGTASWSAISELKPDDLRDGYLRIVDDLLKMNLVAYKDNQTLAALKQVEAKETEPEKPEKPTKSKKSDT